MHPVDFFPEDYLHGRGKPITRCEEVKEGNVLAFPFLRDSRWEVRMYYVERVSIPQPPWFLPYVLTTFLMEPHVGFIIKDNKPYNLYLHVPSITELRKDIWIPQDIIDTWDHDDEVKDLYNINEFHGNPYLVQDEYLLKFGKLIPEARCPLGFIVQNLDPDKVIETFEKLKPTIRKAIDVKVELDNRSRGFRNI